MCEPLQLSLTALHPYLKSSITFPPLSLFFSGPFPCVLDKSPLPNSHIQTHPLDPSFMSSSLNWNWSKAQICSFSIESLLKTFTRALLSRFHKKDKNNRNTENFLQPRVLQFPSYLCLFSLIQHSGKSQIHSLSLLPHLLLLILKP